VTPFALAEHGLRDLFDGQVRKGIRVRAECFAADQQRALVTDGLRKRSELLVRQALSRDQ
jgi:hypothetical protein